VAPARQGVGATHCIWTCLTCQPPSATPFPGCPFALELPGSTVKPLTPPTVTPTNPDAKTVCPGSTADFSFDVAAPGATSLVVSGSTTCSVAAGYKVTCTSVNATTSVTVAAKYGDPAAGDDCATDPVTVPLTLNTDPAITLASVTPASDDICATATSGTLTFQVTTGAAAASVTGSLMDGATDKAVAAAQCTTAGSGTAWTVMCTDVPVGTYYVKVSATSALGESI
jgi:hypothetical protein